MEMINMKKEDFFYYTKNFILDDDEYVKNIELSELAIIPPCVEIRERYVFCQIPQYSISVYKLHICSCNSISEYAKSNQCPH
jgi:hypothetical protein